MINSTSKKTVIAGLMLAIGILLPTVASHGLLILPGKVFLPMHIPVLLCGYLCGAVYGGICGFLLPYLNSILTGMPVMFPNAVIMSFELASYAIMCSLMHRAFGGTAKLRCIYPSLIAALLTGRVAYGIVSAFLVFSGLNLEKLSVISATVSGIPGIIIQLVIVPQIVRALMPAQNARTRAVEMIENAEATCVVVKNNKIVSSSSPEGVKELMEIYDNGLLKGDFVADTVIGKAAAMVFEYAGVKECYGKVVSRAAESYLLEHNVKVTYEKAVDFIVNRRGDGMCPMEATVMEVGTCKEGIALLRAKISELADLKE